MDGITQMKNFSNNYLDDNVTTNFSRLGEVGVLTFGVFAKEIILRHRHYWCHRKLFGKLFQVLNSINQKRLGEIQNSTWNFLCKHDANELLSQ